MNASSRHGLCQVIDPVGRLRLVRECNGHNSLGSKLHCMHSCQMIAFYSAAESATLQSGEGALSFGRITAA
jgi:hypothetical protein